MSEENLNISEGNTSEENVDTPVEANEMPMADSALFGDGGNDEKPPKADAKPPRRVTLTTFVCSCIPNPSHFYPTALQDITTRI